MDLTKDFLSKIGRYEKEIKLKWPVIYRLKKSDPVSQAISFSKEKIHKVKVPQWALYHFDFFLPDLLHELCHCKLAETVDPLFSRIAFPEKYFSKVKENEEVSTCFNYAIDSINVCMDVWVNELRNQRWPKIVLSEHRALLSTLEEMIEKNKFSEMLAFETILSIALSLAEEKKYLKTKNEPSITSIVEFLPEDLQFFILEISEFLGSLPSLSYEKEKDLKLLEISIQELCEILRLPITPYIEKNDKEDFYLWKIKEIEENF